MECPYCQTELTLPLDEEWYTCDSCQHTLNVAAQEAFARGRARYLEVRDEVVSAPSPVKPGNIFQPAPKAQFVSYEARVIRISQQAYSALQVAFQYDLPESQREAGIEMMAELVRLFLYRERISPLEASYWTNLMIELTAKREYEELEQKLAESRRGALGFLRRWRWRTRMRQLSRALVRLDKKIKEIELYIGFLEPPRARKPVTQQG